MSRHAGSIVRGNSKPRRISASQGPTAGGGYLLPAGQKVKVRGAAGPDRARSPGTGIATLSDLPGNPTADQAINLRTGMRLVNRRYLLISNPNETTLWFLKIGAHPARSLRTDGEMTMLSQDQTGRESAAGET